MTEIRKLVIGLLVLIINVSCSHQALEIKTNNRAISEQTTPVTDMKRRWEEECKKLEPIKRSREYPGKQLDVMEKLLDAASPEQVKSELERFEKSRTIIMRCLSMIGFYCRHFLVPSRAEVTAICSCIFCQQNARASSPRPR